MVIFHGDITGNNSWDIDGYSEMYNLFKHNSVRKHDGDDDDDGDGDGDDDDDDDDDILGMIALTMGPQKILAVSLVYNLLHLIWLNYNDLTVLPHWNHG